MSSSRNSPVAIVLILTSFIIIATAILWSLLSKDPEEHVILNPTDTQPGLVTYNDVPVEIGESDNLPSSASDANLPSSVSDAEWNLTLVNKWNPLPENYEIDLVEVPGGEKVAESIYEPLMDMLEAAKEGNWDQLPEVVSGYRTQEKQQELLDEKIEEFKQQGYASDEAFVQANMWVSVPGYSEHQLGTAVDINGATYDLYFWLQENSYKYGFIFRYPAGKSEITGASEEVWHYRYVGVKAATEMYEQGLCLEEYLDKTEK